MKRAWWVGIAVAAAFASAAAFAQSPARVRGVITAVEGNVLAVKSREGEDLRIALADNASIGVSRAVKFEDIKPGDYVGTAAMRRPDGALLALEVHFLPPTAAEGHTPWDLEPGSTMTNANVTAMVAATGKRELTLTHKGGSERVIVPDAAPIVRAVPGARADLVVGEYVFVFAQRAADGRLTAARVQVSKDGVRPPM
jgi:hypothetical protein